MIIIICCICFDTYRFSVFSLRTQVRPSWIWKVENAIHWIKLYPNDCRIGFPNTCPLDSDLSSENCYPMFEKLEPVGYVSKYWHWCFPLRVLGAWSPIYIYIFFNWAAQKFHFRKFKCNTSFKRFKVSSTIQVLINKLAACQRPNSSFFGCQVKHFLKCL